MENSEPNTGSPSISFGSTMLQPVARSDYEEEEAAGKPSIQVLIALPISNVEWHKVGPSLQGKARKLPNLQRTFLYPPLQHQIYERRGSTNAFTKINSGSLVASGPAKAPHHVASPYKPSRVNGFPLTSTRPFQRPPFSARRYGRPEQSLEQ